MLVHWCLSCLILASCTTIQSCNAFSPEVFTQVVAQLGEVFTADELAFAAANLFDSTTPKRPLGVQLKIPKKIISIEPMELNLPIPKIPTSIYDDDYQEVRSVANLDLTPQEEDLLQLLLKVKDKHSKTTTIRVAGGWVRDKLIYGKDTPSIDIDLVLSDISGKDFANLVVRYIQEEKESGNEDVKNVQIEQPSSNKGTSGNLLQNANLIINGFDVDFCRLRYEKYDKDSRIPTSISVASVVEDAWRRDLTINALYYNVNTNEVEDWTEKGITDLILQRIATPKKALPTLMQDPSRVLRAVRFAARLSFDFSPSLYKAAKDDRVHQALQQKVSRDAIGGAIDDMFGSLVRDPSRGILLLIEMGLIDIIFPLGGNHEDDGVDLAIYTAGLISLQNTQSLITSIFLNYPNLEWDLSQRRLLWYAAYFKPFYELMPTNISSSKSKRKQAKFYQVLDAIKRPKSDIQLIETILKGVIPLQDMMQLEEVQKAIASVSFLDDKQLSDLRWNIYSNVNSMGTLWKEALILSLASSQQSRPKCIREFKSMVSLIEDELHLGPILLDKKKMKSLLNGQDIQKVLPSCDGPAFRDIVQSIKEWQVRNDCCDLDSLDYEERSLVETQLVAHLVETFPEYA